jgi:hypothetical protein
MKDNTLRILLVAIGFFQIIGFLTKQDWLKGIGILSTASPLPIVFTQVKEVETFAQDFFIQYTDETESTKQIQITPELYSKLDVPYNYRNVIGAAVSYGPILPEPIWQSVLRYAIVEPGKLAKAIDLPSPLNNPTIVIHTRTQGRDNKWILKLKTEHNDQGN